MTLCVCEAVWLVGCVCVPVCVVCVCVVAMPRLPAANDPRWLNLVTPPIPRQSLDISASFARMLGINNHGFDELMRLYLVIHSDHEVRGGFGGRRGRSDGTVERRAWAADTACRICSPVSPPPLHSHT